MNFSKLLNADVQNYIKENIDTDLTKLLLKKSPFSSVTMQQIAQQIKGWKTAKKKFPFLLKENIIFPPTINLEQSSSQISAEYKQTLFEGKSMIDLTCGFGIDSFFISKNFEEVTLLETNKDLLEIVKHNWNILKGTKADFQNIDLYDYLNNNRLNYSFIYLDPARRDQNAQKKFLLEDLSPNILDIQESLFKFSNKIAVKLSPLIDISLLLNKIKHVSEIHIIAVKNDVKELLIILEKDFDKETIIKCVNLNTDEDIFNIKVSEQKEAEANYGEIERYLYIPNNSVLKSGAFNLVSQIFQINKLAHNTHLYSSNNLLPNFPGRVLEVEKIDSKNIKKGEHYNIISKNYPLTPEQIRKKYKIIDGGTDYLIFTQTQTNKIILKSI